MKQNDFISQIVHRRGSSQIIIDGAKQTSIPEIVAVGRDKTPVSINLDPHVASQNNEIISQIKKQIENGQAIYGVTGSYGGQSARVLNQGAKESRINQARDISNAIVHIDVSTGNAIPTEIVRSAMFVRVNMLASGYSGIRSEILQSVINLLNKSLTPIVGEYGSVGASGDLAQNGRIISTLLQHPTAKLTNNRGRVITSTELQDKYGISPITLAPKEGLALANGDNFSTAAAAFALYDLSCLFVINLLISSLTIQALHGKVRSFHPFLSNVRPHAGQKYVSAILRNSLLGSQLSQQDLLKHQHQNGDETQDPYSLRCLPQYFGPSWERLSQAWETVTINANSVSDNPLWTTNEHVFENEEPYQWVSGGNFLAMHMADTLDALRKVGTLIVKQNDRHLSRLVNPKFSRGLPANLSSPHAVTQCTFKGLQTQMGMLEVYATALSVPINTMFGVHEEHNQDITSQAPASAIMTREVIKLAKLSIATNAMAAAQAVDLRGGPHLLSPQTQPVYELIRKIVPFIKVEQPLGQYVEELSNKLFDFTDLFESSVSLKEYEK